MDPDSPTRRRLIAQQPTGVAWSGLAPEPFPAPDAAALARDDEARATARAQWRHTRSGRLLTAMTEAERAVETVRACVARGLAVSDARCGLALGALDRAAATARQAMDANPPGGLSQGACATNIASSSLSTD
ncbi:hypothetical protein [Phenylobacterium sp.]|uniref:hypothetical protein n=1 Tax=Phenylobacterium sp. TaxID=1871053 RepID=UPI00374DCF23